MVSDELSYKGLGDSAAMQILGDAGMTRVMVVMKCRVPWTTLFAGAVSQARLKVLTGCFATSVGIAAAAGTCATASAETRTLSMYFTHTKESLTVTYKRNGKYDKAALKKINWFLRDWRRNEPTKMSLKTIDLLWELHADLGSKKPVHIISGYRSPRTNAMLKRIGRKVARRSQHMRGRAIDFYFPDVPVEKVMGSAFVRKIGGVGYYPRSGKYGFVHIDNGNVRHWPRMSASRQAKIARKYYKTVAARKGRPNNTQYAAFQPPSSKKKQQQKSPAGPVSLMPASMAEAVVAAVASTPAPKAIAASLRDLAPKPRPRPIEVLMLAAANMQIQPASAPVERQNFSEDSVSPVRGSLGPVTIASLIYEDLNSVNTTAKGSLSADVAPAAVQETGIRPLNVSYANTSSLYDLFSSSDAIARRDGAPQPFVHDEENAIHPLSKEDKSALARLIEAFMPWAEGTGETVTISNGVNRSGKSDSQVVNRSSKGNFTPEAIGTQRIWKQSEAQNSRILKVVEAPLSFEN